MAKINVSIEQNPGYGTLNNICGNVAHQVEQRIENPCVAGSSPAVPTIRKCPSGQILVKSSLSKGEVVHGSNPWRGTKYGSVAEPGLLR